MSSFHTSTARTIATGTGAKRYSMVLTALAAFAARPSDNRPSLESVQVEIVGESLLRLVATDSFALGIVDLPIEHMMGDLFDTPAVFGASDICKLASALRRGSASRAALAMNRTEDGRMTLVSTRDDTAVTSDPTAYFPNWSRLVPPVTQPSGFCRVALRPRDVERAGALCAATDSRMVLTAMSKRGPTRMDSQRRSSADELDPQFWQGAKFVVLMMPDFDGETSVPAIEIE